MCQCEQKQIPGSAAIGDLFQNNQNAIAQVLVEYGLGDLPVSIETAAIGANAYGNEFSQKVARALYSDVSAANGNTDAAITKAAEALNIVGSLVTTVGGVVQMFQKPKTNPAQPTAAQVVQQAQAPAYTPPPSQPQQKILGLTTPQLAIAAGVVVLLGILAFAAFNNNK